MKKMQCKWCGFQSDDATDFEEDYKSHKGVWCPNCDGFTYYNGEENYTLNNLYLEESSDTETLSLKRNQIKLCKRISPLRYPGGKSKMIPLIVEILDMQKDVFVEPFCGGASVGLSLLQAGVINKLVLNDLDFGIYALFWTICNHPDLLFKKIDQFVPTRDTFFSFRDAIQNDYHNCQLEDAAFIFLIVNRLAFSGICKANPKRSLSDRYNPQELKRRINAIYKLHDKITVLNMDANDVIHEYYWNKKTTLFIDPPYYEKGKQLYHKYFSKEDHQELAASLNELYCTYPGCADIIITYDNNELIRKLYPNSEQHIIGRKFCIANQCGII